MFRKLTIALVATASIAAALAPSVASAKGGGMGGGMGGHHHFGHFGGFGIVGAIAASAAIADDVAMNESCFVPQRVMTPYGYRMRTVNVCGY